MKRLLVDLFTIIICAILSVGNFASDNLVAVLFGIIALINIPTLFYDIREYKQKGEIIK